MLIRYLNNGAQKHVPNGVGQGFIDAGLAVLVRADDSATGEGIRGPESFRLPKPGDAVIPEPEFDVTEFAGTDRSFLVIRLRIGARTETWSGDPKQIPAKFGGWPIPKEVATEYKRQLKARPKLLDEKSHYQPRETVWPSNDSQARVLDAKNRGE